MEATGLPSTGKYMVISGKPMVIYGKYMVNPWLLYGKSMVNNSYPLVMTNSLPWFFDGPNQNRWFTELKNGGSFHGKLLVITRW